MLPVRLSSFSPAMARYTLDETGEVDARSSIPTPRSMFKKDPELHSPGGTDPQGVPVSHSDISMVEVPFKDFQNVLAFLSSIGLATAISCAYSLVGATSVFGSSTKEDLAALKRSAILLCWAAACFIVALALIIAAQLLYTETVIVEMITRKGADGKQRNEEDVWQQRTVKIGVGLFAWAALGFQTAAMFLLSQSMLLLATWPTRLARYGIVGGTVTVGAVVCIGLTATPKGRDKVLFLRTWLKFRPTKLSVPLRS
ncbi:hypothetical protein H0H93_003699 [Arthromyces matolae]|nr:hypothetical protein H0H93_003898 [Arthromyces matolae]KAG6835233.1 hypothetical protein H0H93_003699 [Arthromyces matolae]